MEHFVGIDVAKDRLDVPLRPSGETFAAARDGKGLPQLVERAARERATREQEERVKAVLDRTSELEVERARREKTDKAEVSRQKEPRASTTDAEVRAMKFADSGFRPILQHADRVGS